MYATQAGAQHRGLLRDLLILRTEDLQRGQAPDPVCGFPLPTHSCGLLARTNEEGARGEAPQPRYPPQGLHACHPTRSGDLRQSGKCQPQAMPESNGLFLPWECSTIELHSFLQPWQDSNLRALPRLSTSPLRARLHAFASY